MKPWYQKAVFYHIYPLGLLGAPKTNHEASAACRFDELLQWIPHIRDLGCTALYIGPVFESTGHGYDTRDLHLVDRRLGTNEDFKNFVDQCHQHGIRVAVDAVFNHTGREFPAFRDIQEKKEASPYKDWYRGVNFGWGSPMGDSFGYEAWQGHYELPCLNLQNPAVREYLMDTVKFWIDTFHIDGLRLDCANVLDFAFMKELRSRTASMKEDFWLMGEVIHGEYGRWVNGEMLHSVTNYELHKALYSGHNDHNYFEIAHNVKRLESVGRALYTFTDNHDEDRIASKLREPDHLFPVYQLLFTLPGIPSVYYGSEWGIQGARTRESDEALRPALSLKDMEQKTGPITDHIAALARALGGAVITPPAPQHTNELPAATEKLPFPLPVDVSWHTVVDLTGDAEETLTAALDSGETVLALRIASWDDVQALADYQYMLTKPVCFVCDDTQLLEAALRAYQGRALYDGALPEDTLLPLCAKYGLLL